MSSKVISKIVVISCVIFSTLKTPLDKSKLFKLEKSQALKKLIAVRTNPFVIFSQANIVLSNSKHSKPDKFVPKKVLDPVHTLPVSVISGTANTTSFKFSFVKLDKSAQAKNPTAELTAPFLVIPFSTNCTPVKSKVVKLVNIVLLKKPDPVKISPL